MAEKPNVLFILADQQSASMIGCAGNAYVTGYGGGICDFDPDPVAVDSINCPDDFLSKFDTAGIYQWARTWGNDSDAMAIAIDGLQRPLVAGGFLGSVDFAPSGVEACNIAPFILINDAFSTNDAWFARWKTDGCW